MLNEQLQNQIEQEAKSGQHTYPGTDYGHGFNKGYDSGYKFAGEKYAEKWQEAEQRIKELEQWKKEAAALLNPLLDWGQAQKDIPLGCDITKEILRRAKLCGKYEKALKEIVNQAAYSPGNSWHDIAHEMKCIATKALTPKTGSDE